MSPLSLDLDPRSPVPLYHQIAEALRYRIATGAIAIGTVLPPLREAASRWRVNLHTVRRAYQSLAAEGIVATRVPLGTVVQPAGGAMPAPQLAREAITGRGVDKNSQRTHPAGQRRALFLDRVLREAKEKHGLSPQSLLEALASRNPPSAGGGSPTVFVAECSESQSADLARQLEARWRVRAEPWSIDRPDPPGPGALVATYFHYNDLRRRWPERFAAIHFVAISPDPALAARIGLGNRRARSNATLCERENAMLQNMAADLGRILPPKRVKLATRLVRRPAALLRGAADDDILLVSPRLWGDLPNAARQDPRVHEVRYVFDAEGLAALGRQLGWRSRGGGRGEE